jgi:hypothetical protein
MFVFLHLKISVLVHYTVSLGIWQHPGSGKNAASLPAPSRKARKKKNGTAFGRILASCPTAVITYDPLNKHKTSTCLEGENPWMFKSYCNLA